MVNKSDEHRTPIIILGDNDKLFVSIPLEEVVKLMEQAAQQMKITRQLRLDALAADGTAPIHLQEFHCATPATRLKTKMPRIALRCITFVSHV